MRWFISLLVLAASALAAHFVMLSSIPGFIMKKANAVFESQGLPMHQWAISPRQTPQTQRIVRPSPDLAYALCRFDVSEGPVLISAPGWDGYGSLSIFDDQTNNVFVASLDGQATTVLLGQSIPADLTQTYEEAQPVDFSGTGIALIRRLAADEATYQAAAGLVSRAVCEPIT